MLYKSNNELRLCEERFKNPESEYRGAPFWAWNCKVTKEDVDFILNDLKDMGMGGAHIHSRTGMDLPYLSSEFMEMVHYAHEKGKQQGLLTWLYDEDRFPSGAAGGLVTSNLDFRQRFLVLSPELLHVTDTEHNTFGINMRKYLGKYAIKLKQGCLDEYYFMKPDDRDRQDSDMWYLYREIASDNPWFNNQAYVDTLNNKAIERFIELTYDAYYQELGTQFGDTIPAIFTDEPQFCHKTTLGYGEEKKKIILPFTDDFPDTFKSIYGYDFFDTLPECIWNLPAGELSAKRYYFHDHICERFANAYADNIGRWCRNHDIALTGHMMEEPTLASQTAALGEAMRSYRAFGIPGIDMLYDSRELNTAKQAQSAVHQFGAEGMLSELYGVTNWDFDFRGHKLAGDWQAALGVTVRVHHLTWTSMAGEAKRDYPASIGYQSPWYQEYRLIEDYFARVNTALTRGKSVVKIGVIHPIESYWLYWGPREQTQGIRDEMDLNFKKLSEWLLHGFIDFDFIAESLWEELTPEEQLGKKSFNVGEMKYEAIIVPNCVTIRKSTLRRLEAFRERGGRVIFAGMIPAYVDAVPCQDVIAFAESCEKISFAGHQLLNTLENLRMVDVHNQHGVRVGNMLSQIREDSDGKWLFLAHCHKMVNPDIPQREDLTIAVAGKYCPTLYDAMTGEIRKVSYQHVGESTIIKQTVYDHDSLLYFLENKEAQGSLDEMASDELSDGTRVKLPDYAEVVLEEPNVLILDMPEAKLDNGLWQDQEEILKLDNKFRQILGYPLRTEAFPQPWVAKADDDSSHRVTLRFYINSEISIAHPVLALETAEQVEITLNGRAVSPQILGGFVDRAIQKMALPPLVEGENILTAEMPYNQGIHVEAMYLLGEFGVKVAGKNTILTHSVKNLAFGDVCRQGLPFYGGNFKYRIPITIDHYGVLKIEVTQFRAALIGVTLDGEDKGRIAFSPYTILIEGVSPGNHELELIVYGTRINTFGALHNCNRMEPWPGHPDSFRTVGTAWSDEYQLHEVGVLISPIIRII